MRRLLLAAFSTLAFVACQNAHDSSDVSVEKGQGGSGAVGVTSSEAMAASAKDQSWSRDPAQLQTSDGEISHVDEDHLVIIRSGGSQLKLAFSDETHTTLDGKPSKVTALPEGAQVRAAFKSVNGNQVAVRLDATTPRGTTAEGTSNVKRQQSGNPSNP